MRLFSEKVNPTFNSSGYNILTVKDFTEVFFDVYEFEINGSKFVAEKTGVLDDAPIISIPVTYQENVTLYDFVLHRGKQSVYFDPTTKSISTSLPAYSDTDLVLSESAITDEQDEVFLEEKRSIIIEEIDKAKTAAAQYLANIDKQNKRGLVEYQTEKELALKEDIDRQKQILFDEFNSFIDNLRSDLIESDNSSKKALGQIIISELQEASKQLDTKLESIEDAVEAKLEERATLLLNDILLKEIERSNKNISENLDSRIISIEQTLSNSLNETKNQITSNITEKLQEITTELNAKDSSIVELNNTINKQSNRALSRIGTVKTQLEGTVKDVVDSLEARIDSASDKLENYYKEKLQLVESSLTDASEHTKKHIIGLIKESHQSLQNDIANIKVTVPNIVIEKSNGKQEIDVAALRTELEKSVSNRFVNEISSLKRLIELSSGGGSVAMQFAAGGTMNGNLTVVGAISASQYLGITIPSGDYLPLSGGTVTGNVTVTSGLSADRIYTTQLDALSANITVIDIKQYELSGFNVTGNVTINGTVSARNLSASDIDAANARFSGNLTVDTNTLFVDSVNNRVGIGTTTPAYSLDIIGRGGFSNGLIMTGSPTSLSDINYIQGLNSATTVGFLAGTGTFRSFDGPYFAARGNTYSAISNQRGMVFFAAGAVSSPTGNEGTISFSTTPTAGTNESIRLLINRDGNVGIGTTTPGVNLQVTPLVNNSTPLNGSASGAFAITSVDRLYGLYGGVNGSGWSWLQAGRNDSAVFYNLSLQANGGNVGIGTTTPSEKLTVSGNISAAGNLNIGGGLVTPITTVNTNTTLLSSNYVVLADASSSSVRIQLPAASLHTGRTYHIKKIDNTTNLVTLSGNITETIDGLNTQAINAQYISLTIVSNGTNWFII